MLIAKMGLLSITGLAMFVAAAGCKSSMHDQNLALHEQNRELQDQLRQREAERDARPDASMLSAKDAEIAAANAKVAELQAQLRQPAPAAAGAPASDPGIAGIETSFNQTSGEMTVTLPGDVLFDAGRATLKESSKATLSRVAAAIKKDYAGKKIMVDGHTDSDPISKTKSMWKDNTDLSGERARVVKKYLVEQGISADLMRTRALGESKPRGSDKSRNRRVEIVVATR